MRMRKPSPPAVVTVAMAILAFAPLVFFAFTGHHHPVGTTVGLPACAGGNGSAAAAAYADGSLPCRSYTYDAAGLVYTLTGVTELPACMAEDGGPVLPCRWEGGDHGNGRGASFTVVEMNHGGELWFIFDNGTVNHRAR